MSSLQRMLRLLLALACASAAFGCASSTTVVPDQRDQVREGLDVFQRELSRRDWTSVERFFSPQYSGGYIELRNRIEDRNRTERLVQIQFVVNRVMEQDGLLNAQVRWNKSYVDRTGKPQKSTGLSEFTLRPTDGGSFQIVGIRGDAFY